MHHLRRSLSHSLAARPQKSAIVIESYPQPFQGGSMVPITLPLSPSRCTKSRSGQTNERKARALRRLWPRCEHIRCSFVIRNQSFPTQHNPRLQHPSNPTRDVRTHIPLNFTAVPVFRFWQGGRLAGGDGALTRFLVFHKFVKGPTPRRTSYSATTGIVSSGRH